MPLGRLGGFGLQGAAQVQCAGFNALPVTLTEKLVGRGNGGSSNTKVHPNNLVCWCDSGVGQLDGDKQAPVAVAFNEISAKYTTSGIPSCICGNDKRDGHAARGCGETHRRVFPTNLERLWGVPRWTGGRPGLPHLALGFSAGKHALQCLGSPYSCRTQQVGIQLRQLLPQGKVGEMVQNYTVFGFVGPPAGTDVVESLSEAPRGLNQGERLLGGRVQGDLHRSRHSDILLPIGVLVKYRKGGAAFLCTPTGDSSPPQK